MKQQQFTLVLFKLTSRQVVCRKEASESIKVSVFFKERQGQYFVVSMIVRDY